jgi:hypothetical protein
MFCSHCGKEVFNDAVICVNCGRAITPQKTTATNIEVGAKTMRAVARAFLTIGILNIIVGVVVTAVGWPVAVFSVLLGIWEIICASLFWSTPPKVTWNPTYVAILEIVNVISGPFWSLIIGISNLKRLKSVEVKEFFSVLRSGQSIPISNSSSPAVVTNNLKEEETFTEQELIREIHIYIHEGGDGNIGLEIVKSLRPTCLSQVIKPKIIMHNVSGEWPSDILGYAVGNLMVLGITLSETNCLVENGLAFGKKIYVVYLK